MSISEYKTKRDFKKTPEPTGGKAEGKKLKFVIQKHDASRLHYDFRLEMEGVLKSWAVPKGPSMDPKVKRLAMMVEDHPYDYKDFEGIIPKGNYGAGTVIVWDHGTYEPLGDFKTKKEEEKHLLELLKKGNLKFKLNGEKIKGEFVLVKTKGMAENAWLLIKHKDDYASAKDILKQDKSVISGKDLEEMEKNPSAAYGAKSDEEDAKKKPKKSAKKDAEKASAKMEKEIEDKTEKKSKNKKEKSSTASVDALLKKAPKSKFPEKVDPMLATLVDEPFDDKDWEFEVKWDGYRAISYLKKDDVEIMSRNHKPFTEKYYPITQALKDWNQNAVVDGELVVVDKNGVSNFGALQNWRSEADGELIYYVFDLLWYDGKNLMDLPLSDRKAILEEIIPDAGIVRIGFTVHEDGKHFFETAAEMDLEGIIAKKSASKYIPGARNKDWLKIKAIKNQEVVIGGFTKNEGSPKLFSSLLLGSYEDGKFTYSGKVGTGFSDKKQKELMKKFKPLIIKESPFDQVPDVNRPSRFRPDPPNADATWMKPELVAVIKYTEITKDGMFRHPSFVALREDKKPKEVKLETETPTKETGKHENKSSKKSSKDTKEAKETKKAKESKETKEARIVPLPGKATRKTLLNPNEETQVKNINGHDLKFTNLSKVYWPESGYTKRDMLNYYYQAAPFILPYLENRPQSLNRFPNGIEGKNFYQKNLSDQAPDWARTMPYTSNEEKNIDKHFLVATNEASLLYMANLGSIEMNPWSSTADNPDHPDWCILDLDPGSKSTFEDVITVALAIKSLLDELKIEGYPKTSGATGMHIYIPLGGKYTYDESQLFARWVATQIQSQLPDITSIERIIKARKGKLYIDFLQNRPQATLAAPYSVRPKPKATVSMPLHWSEVKKGLKPTDFTIKNAIKRMQKEADLFAPVLGKGIDLEKIIDGL